MDGVFGVSASGPVAPLVRKIPLCFILKALSTFSHKRTLPSEESSAGKEQYMVALLQTFGLAKLSCHCHFG